MNPLLTAALNRRDKLTALLAAHLPPDETRATIEAENAALLTAAISDGDALVVTLTKMAEEAAAVAAVDVAPVVVTTTPSVSTVAPVDVPSADDDVAAAIAAAIETAAPSTPRGRPQPRRASASAAPIAKVPDAPDDWVLDTDLVDGAKF